MRKHIQHKNRDFSERIVHTLQLRITVPLNAETHVRIRVTSLVHFLCYADPLSNES